MKKISLLFILFSQLIFSCDQIDFKKVSEPIEKSYKEIFINEKGDTVVFRYRDNGTIRSQVTISKKRKNGPAFNYYEDGTVQNEFVYKDGFKHGIARFFYETGELYRETNYKDGQMDGLRRLYYKNGAIKAEIPYLKGQLQEGTKEYSSSGNLKTDYPEIVVKRIYASDRKNFYLQFSLNPEKSRAIYYLEVTLQNTHGRIYLDKYTKDGIVTYPFERPSSLMEKMQIKAEIRTRRGNPMILSKDINIAALKD